MAIAGSIGGLAPAMARAEKVSHSGISGALTSASVTIPASSSAVVFTTPPAGTPPLHLVLTQACVTRRRGITLTGSTLGDLPLSRRRPCTTFTPGIVIPFGETLTCATTTLSPQQCMITGELSP